MSRDSAGVETIEDSRALARYHREEGASAYAGKYRRSFGRRRTDRAERALMRRMLGQVAEDASLLNVACGAGRFSDILLGSKRRQVLYCDFSAAMLDEARRTVAALGRDDVSFVQKDVLKDGPPEAHDVVVNVRMLHHLKEGDLRERAFDFLCSASGAALVLTVASDSTFRGWRRRQRGRERGEHVTSLTEVRAALVRRGFEIADVGYVSRLFSSQTWILARRAGGRPATEIREIPRSRPPPSALPPGPCNDPDENSGFEIACDLLVSGEYLPLLSYPTRTPRQLLTD